MTPNAKLSSSNALLRTEDTVTRLITSLKSKFTKAPGATPPLGDKPNASMIF